jgi:ketol-acid reductoisomerase
MHIYRDEDADLSILETKRIAIIGYGNQGRAQALNLRDSGLNIVIGNRDDEYASQAREDGFQIFPIAQAAAQAEIVMVLIPDEITPIVFQQHILPHLRERNTLVFASGYNVAFGVITLPNFIDVVLVAPRMIGAGVRDLYLSGRGFPSFFAIAQNYSGQAKATALALAKGIGSTRFGAVEVTFAQETELDLFTEQCFGPAFGQVLMIAVNLLIEEGYPPEAVLLELYMSGELAYTFGKIAELGMVEQSRLHSHTSQYGSMSRGMRFMIPELRTKMQEGLEEIRNGSFAREWAAEQQDGCPALEALRAAARDLPLHQLEEELRHALGQPMAIISQPAPRESHQKSRSRQSHGSQAPAMPRHDTSISPSLAESPARKIWNLFGARFKPQSKPVAREKMMISASQEVNHDQMERILRRFTYLIADAAPLKDFAKDKQLLTHYHLSDLGLEFFIDFHQGEVASGLGMPPTDANIHLEMDAELLDGMLTGKTNPIRAAMSGKLHFLGDTKAALGIQRIQDQLVQIYTQARNEVISDKRKR